MFVHNEFETSQLHGITNQVHVNLYVTIKQAHGIGIICCFTVTSGEVAGFTSKGQQIVNFAYQYLVYSGFLIKYVYGT